MGFLLLHSDGTGVQGGKEEIIAQFLHHIHDQWNLRIIVTLSDKDISEIKALRGEFPEAKHQLCFWHVLRAIKTHLSILRRAPGYYHVNTAHEEFPFIQKNFVPIAQSDMPLVHDLFLFFELHVYILKSLLRVATLHRE